MKINHLQIDFKAGEQLYAGIVDILPDLEKTRANAIKAIDDALDKIKALEDGGV